MSRSKKSRKSKYAFEFLSIFVAVVSAFALNNWNENKRDDIAETKILAEIAAGLEQDIQDVDVNILGHEMGIAACDFGRRLISQQQYGVDSIRPFYYYLTRDFVSIQNTSGYEALKSRGFELIDNDSLRSKIIHLYEIEYQTLRKLEEEYDESQFHENYFHLFNQELAPFLQFNGYGEVVGLDGPLDLSQEKKRLLMSYLWKIEVNRRFILDIYADVRSNTESLLSDIRSELDE